MSKKRIALFIPNLEAGGAERVVVNLAKGFTQLGYNTDIILVRSIGSFLTDIPNSVNVIDLHKQRTVLSIFKLASCLRKNNYEVLISFITHANICAVISSKLSCFKGKVVLTEHSSITHNLLKNKNISNIIIYFLIKIFYRWANHVVAVSKDLADEMGILFKLHNLNFIYNPIDINTAIIGSPATLPEDLLNFHEPVILGAGRLSKAKNFTLLIQSFSRISEVIPAKLIILGEGEERANLEKLIDRLKLKDKVLLPGFVSAPIQYILKASVFVLSSSWEGFSLVVAEALAAGITVVATDCRSGPAEILENGKYGYLVPVNDVEKMSITILHAINNPIDPILLKRRANDFSIEKATQNYLDLIFTEKIHK